MLDCKMDTSSPTISPVGPMNILTECYGLWENETLGPSPVGKIESTDILDLIEPGFVGSPSSCTSTAPMPNNTCTNSGGGMTLLQPQPHHHHQQNHQMTNPRDYQYQNQNSQYLPPFPNFGDPYSSDPQMFDNFHCMGNMDSTFHKMSDGTQSYTETYDSFIPELHSQTNQIHPQTLHNHHNHHESNPVHHPHQSLHFSQGHHQGQEQQGHGMGHPQVPFLSNSYHTTEPSLSHHTTSTSHHDYIWDDPSEYLFLRKGESPTTSDSVYTDVDSELDSKSSGESLSTLTEIRSAIPPKRRVGRPPKKDKKLKRTEKKTGRLWEFIRDLLKNPEYCPSLVRWENPDEGHFRFVNSEKVAQLWGQIKGNPRMTYEKLSRAMRYYYKSRVFEPVLGRRLVYKFGCNATNWRPINPNFVQKLYT